jgi:hypothetical protein
LGFLFGITLTVILPHFFKIICPVFSPPFHNCIKAGFLGQGNKKGRAIADLTLLIVG